MTCFHTLIVSHIECSVISIVFATIVLGLAADLVSITESNAGLYWNFSALGVATAVLTFVTLIPMSVSFNGQVRFNELTNYTGS